jgi:hypothetical protein
MTTSFADFAAQQEARENIRANVFKYATQLCVALEDNYRECASKLHRGAIERGENVNYHQSKIDEIMAGNYSMNKSFVIETGRKYYKIIMVDSNARSVHAFVDKNTGEVYKPASWRGPAKHVRYDLRVIIEREWLFANADWAGSYLYAR